MPAAERGWFVDHELQAAAIDEIKIQGWLTRRSMGAKSEAFPEMFSRPRDIAIATPVDADALARVLTHHGISPRGGGQPTEGR